MCLDADRKLALDRQDQACFAGRMASPTGLEQLERAPIVEAVCGVLFDKIETLDAIEIGSYREHLRDRFPRHKVVPAIASTVGFEVYDGLAPVRVWLVDATETTIVQVQQDRFYFNWQIGKDGQYPRFTKAGGVRERALAEYAAFRSWIKDRLGVEMRPRNVDVTKVDQFAWQGIEDLAALMPAVGAVVGLVEDGVGNFLVKLEENGPSHVVVASVGSAMQPDGARVTRMETTCTHKVASNEDIDSAITEANNLVNAFFARCVPKVERDRRFGGTP